MTSTDGTKTKIIVGVDGSPSSRAALSWAARQAHLTGELLEVVTVWHMPNDFGIGMTGYDAIDFEALSKEQMDRSIAEVRIEQSDITITTRLIQGYPAPTLLEAAKGASLIVVGGNGHGEFAGMLLGSVSEYLATHGQTPVVIVRGAKDAQET
jgi:nucleotide-binding universal stress UspA family protein